MGPTWGFRSASGLLRLEQVPVACTLASSATQYDVIWMYTDIYIYIWLGMPQNSPCLEVSHQRKVGPCHPPGMVFDPDRGSNGACPGLDLHAMAFLASAWGLQTAGMPRRLQELKSPEVAFGLTSGAGGQSPGRV